MNARTDDARLRLPLALPTAALTATSAGAAELFLPQSEFQPRDCFHCGLPVPADTHWRVKIAGVAQPMCCPGCQAVAQAIVDYGVDGYYQERTALPAAAASSASAATPDAAMALYDTPAMIDGFSIDTTTCETTLVIEGIRCAACTWLIEKRLRAVPGLLDADMNLATERLRVRWQRDACLPSTILSAIAQIGYAAYPFDARRLAEQLRLAERRMFRQLFIAALSMMQVMMYALPLYIAADGTMEAGMADLMRWAGLLLTLPAVLYSARPFFAGAWAGVRRGAPGMDLPVAIGIAAAFIGSTVATVRGAGEVYFDSVTMFIFLLLCSRALELAARRKAAASLEKLQLARPEAALRMAGYPGERATETISADALCAGDFILVRPGDAGPADGHLIDAVGLFDLSLLSGESLPVHCLAGQAVPGGAINGGQAVVLQVSRPAAGSTLSVLMKLIERAGQAKPQLALWADRVAVWFVGALLVLVVIVFCVWQFIDPARAWPIAIAVLVVSCPCALSLATPAALAAVTQRLLRQGILVVQPHVIETLHRVTHVIFDKTGTLTVGRPQLRRTVRLGAVDPAWSLQAAAALEAASSHPLALALLAAARNARELVHAADNFTPADGATRSPHIISTSDVRQEPGRGIEGSIDGRRVRLGSADYVAELTGSAIETMQGPGGIDADISPVYLGQENAWLARFDLADAVREDARAVVEFFQKRGNTVMLLSGDAWSIAHRVADELGIRDACAEYLPHQKLAFVQALQRAGAVVAMVGDGINDAAVLRAADVSFGMGAGTALALAQADAVLLGPHLWAVAEAAKAADLTMAVVRQNLVWATLYNAVAIPAAAIGWLDPWMTAAGMSLSSAVVVLNAWRLRRLPRPPGLPKAAVTASPEG
jgi:Cu2+-exporting ATPase